MKFFLVYPRFDYPTGDPPIGPLVLMSYIRENLPDIEIKFFDATFKPDIHKIKDEILQFSPDVVGIYSNTLMYDRALEIAAYANKLGKFVVVGGPHATVRPDTFLKTNFFDAVVIGEGEKPLLHLLRNYLDLNLINQNTAILLKDKNPHEKTIKLDLIDDLDSLPIPAYDLIDMQKYTRNWFQMDLVSSNLTGTNILASRGCPFQCAFCQPTLDRLFGKKVRIKSPKSIIKELKFLKKNYGINSFIFADDTPSFFKKWMKDFCKLLSKENLGLIWGCNSRIGLLPEDLLISMKECGFRRLMVGIESGSQKILDEVYHKGINLGKAKIYLNMVERLGIKIFAYFMLGAPNETKQQVRRTINLAFSLPIHEATFSITTPLPGTYLESFMREQGYEISEDFSNYDYYSSVITNQVFSPLELRIYQKIAFLKFYLHPRRWKFLLNSINTFTGLQKSFLKLKRLI